MSIKIMNCVWQESRSKGGPLLVLLAIADCANDEGMAYPGEKYLARKARMTDRNVRYAIAYLVEKGELKVEVGAGPHHTNRYFVGVENFSSVEKSEDQHWKNATLEGGSPLPTIRQKREPSVKKEPSEGFARFYQAYPNKQAKPSALRAWNAAKLTDADSNKLIADATKRFAGVERDHIPYPATYLNQRRWEDDIVERSRDSRPNYQPELPDWSLENA